MLELHFLRLKKKRLILTVYQFFEDPLSNIDQESDKTAKEASLEKNKLKVVLDEVNSRIINNCKVEITNSGDIEAEDIAIAFEFRDGTLIPAVGPSSIKPGDTSVYKMAPDLLPLKLNFELSRRKPEKDFKITISHN